MNGKQARPVSTSSMLRSNAFVKHFPGDANLPAANNMPPTKSGNPSVETAWIAWMAATIALAMCLTPALGMTIDLEELPLEPGENFYNGEDGAGQFISHGVEFANTFNPTYGSWNGWSYSRVTDNSSPGFTNQYSAYPGSGAGGSEKYGIAFSSPDGGGFGSYPEILLPPDKTPRSIKVANTTYVALSMLHGDAFSKKFGGPSGDTPDWFRLSVVGLAAGREPVGQVEHYLADYRFADPAEDYVLDVWQEVDLTPLAGLGVAVLQIQLHSSDMGPFGMNTPAYVAADDLVLADSVLLGDYNNNGVVDTADYTAWRDRLGNLVTPPGKGADGNGNGRIDHEDYVVWKTSYETNPGTGKTTVVAAVPEPTGLLLLATGTLATFFYLLRFAKNIHFVDPVYPHVLKSVLWSVAWTSVSQAGPFLGFQDRDVTPNSMTAWANEVISYAPTPGVTDTPGYPPGSPAIPNNIASHGLGPADGKTVSLGELTASQIATRTAPPGEITVGFARPVFNGPQDDLAIFENAGAFYESPYIFAELAFVEISSNGLDFARFPAVSLNIQADGDGVLEENELSAPYGLSYAGVNTTNLHNLAGIHPAGTGTPLDLQELANDPLVVAGLVDLHRVKYVRLVDIPGNGSFFDSQSNPIFDAWETSTSGGFDLDAVGAIHTVPEPTMCLLTGLVLVAFATRWRFFFRN